MTANADIVVGAGIWGCTVARRLAEAGRRVLVLERRAAVGGNVRCKTDPETGIEVHLYGSHIFHTGNDEVWSFVRRFAEFNGYRHRVLARCKGNLYHLPIGCTLLEEFFGRDAKPSELDEIDRKALFDAFIRGYTSKQWGVAPEKVDSSVIARLRVRDDRSIDYFDDPHQGIPSEGYNRLFERMLEHPNIAVKTTAEFTRADLESMRDHPVFYSGAIDELFGYECGALPWRTLRFETERLPVADAQGASVVNFVDADVPYTRQHEFKHYHPEWKRVMELPQTIVMREYSAEWKSGDEPYYPVKSLGSEALLARYRVLAEEYPNLILGGRLGRYRYLDMDQSMADALSSSCRYLQSL